MSWTVPSDLRNPEPMPDHFDPSTWRICLASHCHVKVDPWEHSFRCADHRQPVAVADHRHVELATSSTVRQAITTETLYDPDYPRRLLDAVTGEAPNLVARVMRQMNRVAP